MELRDQELLSWIDGTIAVPAAYDTPLFRRLRDFNHRIDR